MWPVLIGCLVLSALTLLWISTPDLRPLGLDPVGPGDRPPRPGHHGRAVVEAAADLLHDPVLALGDARGAVPVAVVARAGAFLAVAMAYRVAKRLMGRLLRRLRRHLRGAGAVLELPLRPRRRARQLRGDDGGARAVGLRAPPRRPPRPRALPRRGGRAAAARGVALPRPLRPLALVQRARPAAAAGLLRAADPGALVPARVVGARATPSAPGRAPTTRTRAARRSPSTRSSRSPAASARW